ncbi:hypothetical protein F4782DRAFT_550260 [Xylaria castorea]|nr:hypothetical protein F4782DRAFT_550260 [Xylaria castorea]
MKHDSRRRIVRLLADHDEPITTDIKKQLVDERRRLDETSAGREAQSELIREWEKWEKERKKIKRRVKEAIKQKDREAEEALEEALEEERERFTSMVKKVEEDTTVLLLTLEDLIARRDKKVADIKEWMNKRETSNANELKRPKSTQMHIEPETITLAPDASQLPTLTPLKNQVSLLEDKPTYMTPRSPYSVSIHGEMHILTSPGSRYSSSKYRSGSYPPDKIERRWRESASIGDCGAWIARFFGRVWRYNDKFPTHYPHLGMEIRSHGFDNLDVCFLGSQQRHFARWQDGKISYVVAEEASSKFQDFGHQIVAVAFDIRGSYLFSYGTDTEKPKFFGDLKGYYPTLKQVLDGEKGLSILVSH